MAYFKIKGILKVKLSTKRFFVKNYLNLWLFQCLHKIPFNERPFTLQPGLMRCRRLSSVLGFQIRE